MSRTLCYIIIGYLSGSILYARVFEKLFHKENMIEGSKDRNPGTANAFMRGGFWCREVVSGRRYDDSHAYS